MRFFRKNVAVPFGSNSFFLEKIITAIPNSLTAHFPLGEMTSGGKWLYEVRIIHYIVILPIAIFRGRGRGMERGEIPLSDMSHHIFMNEFITLEGTNLFF